MKNVLTPFKVGLVMIGGLVALIVMLAQVSRDAVSDGEGYRVFAHLKDASGLSEKSRVVIAGIDVGMVESVALDGPTAKIGVRVQPDVKLFGGERSAEGVLTESATLAKRRTSLVGAFYIELTPGLRGTLLKDGDEVPVVVAESTPNAVVDQMSGIATDVRAITGDVKKMTGSMATVFGSDQTAAQMAQTIRDVQETVHALRDVVVANQGALNRIVGNTEAASDDIRRLVAETTHDTDQILSDVAAITSELRGIVGRSSVDVAAGIGTLRGTLASAQEALDRINYSLENVQRITERVERGEGTIGKLVNDPAISEQAKQLVTTANGFVQRVNNLQTVVEFRSSYGASDRAFKNVIGLSLRPEPDKFYDFELVQDPRGRTRRYSSYELTTDPSKPVTVYEERQETSDSLELSFQLGHRWALDADRNWMLGGRFGLIESTGGLGANLWTWHENVEVRADVFDFTVRQNPRLRTYLLWRFTSLLPQQNVFSHLFAQGGVDDWLNPGVTNYFGGLGFSFNDQDLKSILMAAPKPTL